MKYGRYEYERSFLIPPHTIKEFRFDAEKQLLDKYITDTNLRLRAVTIGDKVNYKLTQKTQCIPNKKGVRSINTLYIPARVYHQLHQLPGYEIEKIRHLCTLDHMQIAFDCIHLGSTHKAWLAEVEFENEAEMNDYRFPLLYCREVTDDSTYNGYSMAKAYQEAQQKKE